MERRNWSIEAFNKLKYIDSQDDYERADSLELWSSRYLTNDFLNKLDLEYNDLLLFNELFYKNINFLKKHQEQIGKELDQNKNIKKFLI